MMKNAGDKTHPYGTPLLTDWWGETDLSKLIGVFSEFNQVVEKNREGN